MAPDDYQKAWQAHLSQTRIEVDADLLLKKVQRSQLNFRATIFWRDFREAGISLLMLPVWLYLGYTWALPWTWYLTVPVLIWHVVFMLAYRMRHAHHPSHPNAPLLPCVERSVAEVDDQIWLLRNIFWWSLLPSALAILAFLIHSTWAPSRNWTELAGQAIIWVAVLAVYGFVYALNQQAVRSQLEPRRQALGELLTSLRDETSGRESPESVTVPVASLPEDTLINPNCTPVRFAIGFIGFVVIVFAFASLLKVAPDLAREISRLNLASVGGYPKQSPFAAVRWRESQPEVLLDKTWYKLVSLNDLPAAEIVAFCRRTYEDRWRKRFEEDLVEVLTGMKHPPDETVRLVVESIESLKTSTFESVPMTAANRRAIRKAAQERTVQPAPRRPALRSAVSIDDIQQFKKRADQFLHRACVETGFSGVVLVARKGDPIYQGSVGYSSLESRTPNSLGTAYQIAALSQTFTAAATLALESDGKLNTSDPVHRYLPEFSGKPYAEITIHHLLTHSSGLPRIPEDTERRARWIAMSKAPTSLNDYVQLACKCPLKFQPGQRRLYSNIGYRILSALIEQATNQDFANFMHAELFEPLGLDQSGVARVSQPQTEDHVAEVISLVSHGARTSQPTFLASDNGQNYGAEYGNGGIYSSATDLLKWDRILAAESYLSSEQTTKLFHVAQDDYACGWIVKRSEPDGRIYQVNTGANSGYFSKMMRLPEDGRVIIALGNVRRTDAIAKALDQLFLLCRSLPYEE